MPTSSSARESETQSPRVKEPVYTRKLIPRIYVDPFELDEDFDIKEWYKKVYGPDIIVIGHKEVPDGWIMVDGKSLTLFLV